ncbi:MAG: DUF1638 domain-containing protein [Bryobacterales bacterium]|jgi:hypothetical protein|nr:DUF1638 domain-containing protein [Bryobacterales bacterium]
MRVRLVACEVLCRELSACLAEGQLVVDPEFLPKGLHDDGGPAMRARLQQLIDQTDPTRYQAVLLGYALCGTGTAGLVAREIPVVIPRAHDCIALLLGSRAAHDAQMAVDPGTFFRSPGWVERGADLLQLSRRAEQEGHTLEDLIRRYGEDNGRYLFDEFHRYRARYSRLVYIDTGVAGGRGLQAWARDEASRNGWRFETVEGNQGWFRKLLEGSWDDDFVVLRPGEQSVHTYDDDILRAEPGQRPQPQLVPPAKEASA